MIIMITGKLKKFSGALYHKSPSSQNVVVPLLTQEYVQITQDFASGMGFLTTMVMKCYV